MMTQVERNAEMEIDIGGVTYRAVWSHKVLRRMLRRDLLDKNGGEKVVRVLRRTGLLPAMIPEGYSNPYLEFEAYPTASRFRSAKAVTTCEFFSITGVGAWLGKARCSFKDAFDEDKGRKVSLARAIAARPRSVRTKIWVRYLELFPPRASRARKQAILETKPHVNCPCWATGKYTWTEGCSQHPVKDPFDLPLYPQR